MDILISSNLERLIYYYSNCDDKLTRDRMAELKNNGKYSITEAEKKELSQLFYANYSDEDDTIETIQDFFEDYNYPLDPHTGVALSVYYKYIDNTEDKTKTVIVSTASPYKFPQDVLFSITGDYCGDSFRSTKKLYKETALEIPENIMSLKTKPQIFKQIINGADIKKVVLNLVN